MMNGADFTAVTAFAEKTKKEENKRYFLYVVLTV